MYVITTVLACFCGQLL